MWDIPIPNKKDYLEQVNTIALFQLLSPGQEARSAKALTEMVNHWVLSGLSEIPLLDVTCDGVGVKGCPSVGNSKKMTYLCTTCARVLCDNCKNRHSYSECKLLSLNSLYDAWHALKFRHRGTFIHLKNALNTVKAGRPLMRDTEFRQRGH